MIAKKPPMGWNSWNTFGADINEKLIMETADTMAESGLLDAGYNYLVIDDIWSCRERDKNGRLVADPQKFPNGMKYIADYVHSKGLKFGMYSDCGYTTCAGYPGSYGHEWTDACTFAEWGVDFLKYDICCQTKNENADILYKRMSLALANCGRDILFSTCSAGYDDTLMWVRETGANMWRSDGDIFDNWNSIKEISQRQLKLTEYNWQGCFNDMDMLVVGMNGKGNVGLGGCTFEEYKLHFSLWALLNSPLFIGCDIRNMTEETKRILLNKDVIAVNQDSAVRKPFFVNRMDWEPNNERKHNEPFYKSYPLDTPIILKFLRNGDIAIGIFNFTDEDVPPSGACVLPDMFGLPISTGKTLELTDLWTGEKSGPYNGLLSYKGCKAHSCLLYRARVVDA